MAAADPLLRRPRPACVGLQEFGAMIRLDHDDVAFADALVDVLRCVAEIGQDDDRTTRSEEVAIHAGAEAEANRLLRIMGYGEAFDFQVAKPEARPRLK